MRPLSATRRAPPPSSRPPAERAARRRCRFHGSPARPEVGSPIRPAARRVPADLGATADAPSRREQGLDVQARLVRAVRERRPVAAHGVGEPRPRSRRAEVGPGRLVGAGAAPPCAEEPTTEPHDGPADGERDRLRDDGHEHVATHGDLPPDLLVDRHSRRDGTLCVSRCPVGGTGRSPRLSRPYPSAVRAVRPTGGRGGVHHAPRCRAAPPGPAGRDLRSRPVHREDARDRVGGPAHPAGDHDRLGRAGASRQEAERAPQLIVRWPPPPTVCSGSLRSPTAPSRPQPPSPPPPGCPSWGRGSRAARLAGAGPCRP